MSAEKKPEEEVLSREVAKSTADNFRQNSGVESDLLKSVPPSLLSAQHIRDYVMETGLISPFHMHGKKPRLKKASYEGRIGEYAYFFEDGKIKPAIFVSKKLQIPANSIVFVECNLDFRLPENIALRFNLHIEHVHRGLLLGTGPLVDPGFRGKLCIPLHNLTSENYEISTEEGLVWFEFTKTTSIQSPEDSIGVEPSNTEYWDILKFITKAAKGVGGATNVPIQSSIKGALLEFENNAKKSRDSADAAKKYVRFLTIGALAGILVGAVSIGQLVFATIAGIQSQVQITKSYVDSSVEKISELEDALRFQHESLRNIDAMLEALPRREADPSDEVARSEQTGIAEAVAEIDSIRLQIESILISVRDLSDRIEYQTSIQPQLPGSRSSVIFSAE